MRAFLLAAAVCLGSWSAAHAGVDYPPQVTNPTCADGSACPSLTTVLGLVPQPSNATPNAPQPTAAAGSSLTYQRGDATTATLCRRTTTTTASDGSFAVTWATPLTSPTPWGHVEPIYTGATMPPVCWMRSISANGITGQCSPTQTVALTAALVTTGITVSPFGPNSGAAGLTVKVSSCEPTQ